MTPITAMGGDIAVKEQFLYVTEIKCYKFKLEYYNFQTLNVIPVVTTKKITIEYTQKDMRKKFKHSLEKNQLNTKEDSNAGKEGQKK